MVLEQINVGSRIEFKGSKGTVKYVGVLLNAEGVWLGIDWDDPQRGKHNGTHCGIQYFESSFSTSGSFIHPDKVLVGVSIIEAIKEKYGLKLEPDAGLDHKNLIEAKQEMKAKTFEVVGFSKLNEKQSNFQNLNVVLLRNYPVCSAGPPLALSRLCPKVEELDLSNTLLNNWDVVGEIVNQLENLKTLNLSDNYLKVVENTDKEWLPRLNHIILGNVMHNWSQVLKCAKLFPHVKVLQAQNNKIDILKSPGEQVLSNLKVLDLGGNEINNWNEINKLGDMINLELLNLAHCRIKKIFFPSDSLGVTNLFMKLNSLIMTSNLIEDWLSISELEKLKNFSCLRFQDNPILEKESVETNRQLIIAKIKSLQKLNGQIVSREERKGAEIDYLKRFGKFWLELKSEEDKEQFYKIHPSYQRLVTKYGAPEEAELPKAPTSLKSQLIEIEILSSNKSFIKKVPYNMSIQKLCGLIQRLFQTDSKMPSLYCSHSKRSDGLNIFLDNYLKDLNYYSVENGDKILVSW